MPLLDHFHPPLYRRPPWESVTTTWAVMLTDWLNRTLPEGEFVAYPTIHLGAQVEADVAEYDLRGNSAPGTDGGVSTLPEAPPAALTVPVIFPDDIEVRVGTSRYEWDLCGVIELVSEANKKEASERRAFVNKCAAYLQRGIGLVVVDVVTNRLANLHAHLMQMIGGPEPDAPPPNYVVGYRPVRRAERNEMDVWPYPAAVGRPLPATPLYLRRGPTVVLPLEETYVEAVGKLGLRAASTG